MTLNELDNIIKKEKINNDIKIIQISIVEEDECNQVFNSREVLTTIMELDDALKMFGNMQIESIGTPSRIGAFIKITLVYDVCGSFINIPINECDKKDLLNNDDCTNATLKLYHPTNSTPDL